MSRNTTQSIASVFLCAMVVMVAGVFVLSLDVSPPESRPLAGLSPTAILSGLFSFRSEGMKLTVGIAFLLLSMFGTAACIALAMDEKKTTRS